MIKNWITFGMSAFTTPGFQDTSRLMTSAWKGPKVYVEPPKPFRSWINLDGKVIRWSADQIHETTVLQPPLPVPSRIDPYQWSARLQAKTFNYEMSAYFGADWRNSSLVYVTNWTPYLQPFISKLKPKYLVLDFVDDILNFPYNWDVQRVNAQYKRLIQNSSSIIAVSSILQHQIRTKFGKESTVLSNGVNETFFFTADTTPDLLNNINGKLRIGFAGTLNHWIDFESMDNLANLYPENAFILMGKRGHLGNTHQERALEKLFQRKNVHFLGPIRYEELPTYLHNMDILLLPRCPSKSSEASSPLKLYEYLAVGKPIVTSGFPVPSEVRPLVYHSHAKEGLVLSIQSAIRELQSKQNDVKRQQRQAFARQNTWQQRVQAVECMIEKSKEIIRVNMFM